MAADREGEAFEVEASHLVNSPPPRPQVYLIESIEPCV